MGYTTDFSGSFKLNKKLDEKMAKFLREFVELRHGGESKYDNTPGIWCGWQASEDNLSIEWDEGEKFYHYNKWMSYLIDNFLQPNGYVLNGTVEWQGESSDDIGKIVIIDNSVDVKYASVTYEDVDALLKENEELRVNIAELILLTHTE
jgi:hypothetical protein